MWEWMKSCYSNCLKGFEGFLVSSGEQWIIQKPTFSMNSLTHPFLSSPCFPLLWIHVLGHSLQFKLWLKVFHCFAFSFTLLTPIILTTESEHYFYVFMQFSGCRCNDEVIKPENKNTISFWCDVWCQICCLTAITVFPYVLTKQKLALSSPRRKQHQN